MFFESFIKLFDKLTVKPNQLLLEIYFRQLLSSESAALSVGYALPG
jgi:hypothetical protein